MEQKKVYLDDVIKIIDDNQTYYDNGLHTMDGLVRDNIIRKLQEMPTCEEERPTDSVNHPSHYNRGGIECFDVINDFYGWKVFEHFCLGNVLKYTMRCCNKGKYIEDLKKARFYIDEIVKLYDKLGDNPQKYE